MTLPMPLGRILVEHHAVPLKTYTPLLLAATTNPTLGVDAVQEGRYWRDPRTGWITGQLIIKFGTSGSAPGSGNYSVTLPTAAYAFYSTTIGQADIWGYFSIRDNSAPNNSRFGLLTRNTVNAGPGGVALAFLSLFDGTATNVTHAYPFAWTNGDAVAATFCYPGPP